MSEAKPPPRSLHSLPPEGAPASLGAARQEAMLIEARGIHTYYGASHVLHGVDFRIGRGETIGLMGRNGMGKTTLIRSMLGHVPMRQGKVCVRGEEVSGLPPYRIARLGVAYVPEGRGIFANLSVRENLVMAARAGIDGRREGLCRNNILGGFTHVHALGTPGWADALIDRAGEYRQTKMNQARAGVMDRPDVTPRVSGWADHKIRSTK